MKWFILLFLLPLGGMHAQKKMKFNIVAEVKPFINFDNPDVQKELNYPYTFNPVKSNAGVALGLGIQGIKNRFMWGMSVGWQRNQTIFEMQHPEIASQNYSSKVTSNMAYLKAGAGFVLKSMPSGAHVDLLFSAGLLYKVLYSTDGTEVIYEPYVLEGETYYAPVFYVKYDFKNNDNEVPVIYTFSFGPNYQTKTLFGRSTLRVGLEFTSAIGGKLDRANFVAFRGNDDRSIIANSILTDKLFNLGLKIGLTF